MTAATPAVLRLPLVEGERAPRDVTDDVCRPLEGKPTGLWWAGLFLALSALGLGVVVVTYMLMTGIGTWGLNRTVGWGFDITNFVFWVGIGHAGTLISAVLFLFRQKWRTAVNRSAEAMTIFAVMCAGLFPLIHMGRPWLAYWVFPYPNTRGPLWINFRSALCWDVFAVSTYFLISLGFWYIGMIPDLATLRDRTSAKLRGTLFRWFSLGWNGSTRTWLRYETVYLLLAGLATPLVFSVHSIVSFDFATSIIPGWHTTIFAPYFVAGAIFSGLAMVLTLMLIARKVMRLENYITKNHVSAMCKLIMGMGGIVATAYATEFFIAWYSGNEFERFAFLNRAMGPFAWAYWIMVGCNVLSPQMFWFKKVRSNLALVFVVSIFINIGMWFERFVIIVTSLHRDFLPSAWRGYVPTNIEIATLVGSFGLFFTCFLLFCRFLPVISMAEVKGVLSYGRPRRGSLMNRNLMGVFTREADILDVTVACRQRGYEIVDVYAPYPVHGLDRAMGLRPSRITWACFVLGMTGAAAMLWFQVWASAVDWPANIGGKPLNSLPAFIPVAFETAVLMAGLGTIAVLLVISRLFPWSKPNLVHPRVTDDHFVLAIRQTDADLDPGMAERLLRRHGAIEVREDIGGESS